MYNFVVVLSTRIKKIFFFFFLNFNYTSRK